MFTVNDLYVGIFACMVCYEGPDEWKHATKNLATKTGPDVVPSKGKTK